MEKGTCKHKPELTCVNCRWWDYYYCEFNNTREDGTIKYDWGNCTQDFGKVTKFDETSCRYFECTHCSLEQIRLMECVK